MDSCHIFNFLFGTRKATSEFTKCFSSTLSNNNKSSTNQSSSSSAAQKPRKPIVATCDRDGTNISTSSCNQQSPHQSPLKQIQQKLASLSLSSKFKSSESPRVATEQQDWGTHRPTTSADTTTPPPSPQVNKLIQEQPANDDEHATYEVAIVENPIHPSDLADEPDCDNTVATTRGVCSADDEPTLFGDGPQWEPEKDNLKVESVEQQQHPAPESSNIDGKVRAELCRVECADEHEDFDDKNNKPTDDEQIARVDQSRQLFKDKKSERVRHLVQSFELSSSIVCNNNNNNDSEQTKPPASNKIPPLGRGTTLPSWPAQFSRNENSSPGKVLPTPDLNNNNLIGIRFDANDDKLLSPKSIRDNLQHHQQHISAILQNHKSKPPRTPPKSVRAKYFNWQLTNLRKPARVEQLFHDEEFLGQLFDYLEPLDRCAAAQVCRSWRKILYSKQSYWKELINVIDCTQLRREHLIECIMNTLHQSAKLKQQQSKQIQQQANPSAADQTTTTKQLAQQSNTATIDQDEVWRIQELCNRYSRACCSSAGQSFNLIRSLNSNSSTTNEYPQQLDNYQQQQQQQQQITIIGSTNCQPANGNNNTSKSSSIPSQISSSTLSSISISSLLSPLSESSRIDSLREKLYNSIDDRGFDAICLFGATDEDIEDLSRKTPPGTHKRILVARLNNCCLTDRGLDLFLSTFNQLEELELSGCNEISNAIDLKQLTNLEKLIITDCTNIADGFAQKLIPIFHQLSELTIQSYHLTDSFLDYVSLNSDTSKLKRLELPNCKEITNQSMLTIAKHFPNVESLSISGSTKITDDGIEILTEQAKRLRCLDLSWCTKITDASLECIACDLTTSLTGLILDRNVHITDIGLGYLSTMTNLELIYIRWCSRVTDLGLESLFTLKNLKYLSLAGLNQITARSLLCLIEVESLVEVELTNCCAVNGELLRFLADKMPRCNIVF